MKTRSVAAGGGRAAPFVVDVTDGGTVAEAIADASRELGPVEILVNNAGWDELKPFVETDEEFWERVIAINFKGCLHTTRAVLPGKLVDALVRAVPMRRLGEPEDVAAAVAFFASDRAGFITGQTLSVSGGLTMA
ncbi:MAG: SDR family oxidoreductase [Thermoleophilaceae bacterium]